MLYLPAFFSPVRPPGRTGRLIWSFRGLTGRHPDEWRFDQVIARHEIELRSDLHELVNVQLAAEAIDYSVIMPSDASTPGVSSGEAHPQAPSQQQPDCPE